MSQKKSNSPIQWIQSHLALVIGLLGLLTALAVTFFFWAPGRMAPEKVFEVERPVVQDLSQQIYSSGKLQLAGLIKVGSQVTGTLQEIYVSENETVEKGQLLALIDNGKGDTDVRAAEGTYNSLVASANYLQLEYDREKALRNEQFASESNYDQAEQAYISARDNAKAALARLEKANIDYGNIQIKAPGGGIITRVGLSIGQRVQTDLDASVLFEIAPDVKKMITELVIDERDIGQIKARQEIQMVVDTYPNKVFRSTVESVSFTPKEIDKKLFYQAIAFLDNTQGLLRPGMTVTATIDVASAGDVLTITSRSFLIEQETIEQAADVLGYRVEAIEPTLKKELVQDEARNTKFIWIYKDDSFIERPVVVGINNNIFFEIKSGLTKDDQVVVDVAEKDVLSEFYQRFKRKGL